MLKPVTHDNQSFTGKRTSDVFRHGQSCYP
jgi:hypothetical protein